MTTFIDICRYDVTEKCCNCDVYPIDHIYRYPHYHLLLTLDAYLVFIGKETIKPPIPTYKTSQMLDSS